MASEICIIDDEPELVEMCADFLKDKSPVKKFTSPAELLRLVKDNGYKPGLIVTDLKMPEIDGLALVKELRNSKYEGPIIMMSGYLEKKSALQAIESGVGGFVEKPFDMEKLRTLVDKVVAQYEYSKVCDQLIERYRAALSSCIELKSRYVMRYAAAENAIYAAGAEEIAPALLQGALLEQVKIENQFERQLSALERDIKKLIVNRDQLRLTTLDPQGLIKGGKKAS